MTPGLDDAAARAQLGRNTLRLIEAALQQDAAAWADGDAADAQAPPAEPALPLLDLDAMDLTMLDGLDAIAPPPPPDASALQAAQQALPPGLAPLSSAWSDDDFARWLALFRQGEPAVVELVTLVRRLDP